MEHHFPHLTNGISATKPVKKRKLGQRVAAVFVLVAAVIYSLGL